MTARTVRQPAFVPLRASMPPMWRAVTQPRQRRVDVRRLPGLGRDRRLDPLARPQDERHADPLTIADVPEQELAVTRRMKVVAVQTRDERSLARTLQAAITKG